MPVVEVVETLHCDIDTAWKLVIDIESYPSRMESVRSVCIIENNASQLVSNWVVTLKDSEMKWTEQEIQRPLDYRVDFHQIEGDLARFDGYWQLERLAADRTAATLLINFDIGIPALDDILNPIAIDALRDNSQRMLRGLDEASRISEPLRARG